MRGVKEDTIKENSIGTDIQVAAEETAPVKNIEGLQVALHEEEVEDIAKNVSEEGEENAIEVTQQVPAGAKAKPEAKRKKKEKNRRIRAERNLGKYPMRRW